MASLVAATAAFAPVVAQAPQRAPAARPAARPQVQVRPRGANGPARWELGAHTSQSAPWLQRLVVRTRVAAPEAPERAPESPRGFPSECGPADGTLARAWSVWWAAEAAGAPPKGAGSMGRCRPLAAPSAGPAQQLPELISKETVRALEVRTGGWRWGGVGRRRRRFSLPSA